MAEEKKEEKEKAEPAEKKEAQKVEKKEAPKTEEKESKEAAEEVDADEKPEIKVEKDIIKNAPAGKKAFRRGGGRGDRRREKKEFDVAAWQPKTSIGKKVKSGEIKDINEILDNGYKILEAPIVDILIPNLETDLLLIGQSKGKFGGGQRRVFKQTQKKTKEGNKPKFATTAVTGNKDGFVGIGYGKSKETVPAREKAIRNSKLDIFKIRRGCGDWQCGCKQPHSIPFTVEGKCGSVRVKLMPAPRGKGLIIEEECGKILKMAGIKDVWSKTLGHTATKVNLIYACIDALKKLMSAKVHAEKIEKCGICAGKAPKKTE